MASTRQLKRSTRPPKGYDSWFEYDAHKNHLTNCSFHTEWINYVTHSKYEPDFKYVDSRGYVTYIETKGRFRDSAEARKYKSVRSSLKKSEILVFIFQNPNTPFPHARKRKDGTKKTHGEWAELNGFTHYTLDTIPKEWMKC